MGFLVGIVVAAVACHEHGSTPVDAPLGIDAPPGSSAKELTSFRFLVADNPGLTSDLTAAIVGNEISAVAVFPTTLAGLVATFETTGVRVSLDGQEQFSGKSAITFGPGADRRYVVVAEDGSSRTYNVRIRSRGFALKRDFVTGASPGSVVAADFNGDGKADLAVTSQTPAMFSILTNTAVSGATIASFTRTDIATAPAPGRLAIADVDGDGKPDVAVANPGPGTVSVFLNTTPAGAATPTFAARSDVPAGAGAFAIAIADLDADGKPDLAVANGAGADSMSVLLNTTATGAATASFAAKVDYPIGPTPTSIVAGDLDGDGRPDLVASHHGGYGRIWAWINTTPAGAAAPSFAESIHLVSGQDLRAVYLGDVNADGRVDLVVPKTALADVAVFLNTTAAGTTPPTFGTPAPINAEDDLASVGLADVDQDGTMDIVASSAHGSGMTLLLGTTAPGAATASFRIPRRYGTGQVPTTVAIADFNGDAKPDVAITNELSGSVSVLLAE